MSVLPTSTLPEVDCAIIVVTYNSERHIVTFLESIAAAAQRCTWRAIVVDNGSIDDTRELVVRFAQVTLVATGHNGGYAAGINVGRDHAGPCRSILIANPDLRLARGSIDALFCALRDEDAGVVVPLLRDARGRLTHSLRREPTIGRQFGEALLGDHLPGRPGWLAEVVRESQAYCTRHPVDWAGGAALMVSKRCDEAVGRWDESYFLFSEEIDFARRVRAAGFAIVVEPEASAVHHEGGSGRSGWFLQLVAINRLRYFRSCHGRTASLVYAFAVLFQFLLRGTDKWHRRAALAVARVTLPAVWWNRFPDALLLPMRDCVPTDVANPRGDYWHLIPVSAQEVSGSVDTIAQDDVAVTISARSRTSVAIGRHAIARRRKRRLRGSQR